MNTQEHTCEFLWHETVIGGFAQCRICNAFTSTEVKREKCLNFISPEKLATIEKERKNKRKREREITKLATIEFLKKKGLPYHYE